MAANNSKAAREKLDYNQVTYMTVKNYLDAEMKKNWETPKTAQAGRGYNLFQFPVGPKQPYNEVFPSVYLGDRNLALNKRDLKEVGITHVVNAAQGEKFNMINTNAEFYKDIGVEFIGVSASDVENFRLDEYFQMTTDFIFRARMTGGKVYVHCQQGISRSSATVAAFLMIKEGMNVEDAIKTIRAKREIYPNDGFLKQLCSLNKKLYGR